MYFAIRWSGTTDLWLVHDHHFTTTFAGTLQECADEVIRLTTASLKGDLL